jgi:hypothetical protein
MKTSIKKRYLELYDNLQAHYCLYFFFDIQEVSNKLYDSWRDEFYALQKSYGHKLPEVDYREWGYTGIRKARHLLLIKNGVDDTARNPNPFYDRAPTRYRKYLLKHHNMN